MRRFGVVTEEEQEERGDWYLAKQIAAGILIASAVIFVGFHLYLALFVGAAVKAGEELGQQWQREFQDSVRRSEGQFAEARRVRIEREAAQELERRKEIARQTQAAADRAKAEQARAAAKQRAWQQFYTPLKKCENPPDWDTQVECGNAHMKAKKEFEERWARGEIAN